MRVRGLKELIFVFKKMEPQSMGNMGGMGGGNGGSKKGLVIGVVVVVLVLLGWMLFKGDKMPSENGTPTNVVVEDSEIQPKAGEIAVDGKLGCTPLKSGAAPTADECVLGLMGADGKFYALDTSKIETAGSGINAESDIIVVGVLTAVDADSEEAGIFKYDGVMAVRVMAAK